MKKVTFSLNGRQISVFLPDEIWKNIGTNLSENEKRRYLKQIAASPSQTLSDENDQFYVHTVYQTGGVLFTLYTRDGKNLRVCSSGIQEEPQFDITISDATEEEVQTAYGYFSALGLSDEEAVRDTMQEVIFKKTKQAPIEADDVKFKSGKPLQNDHYSSDFAKDFIQYNVIASLYNAARDYYKDIWNECKKKPKMLRNKINSFTRKFQGIVKINDNLELTSFTQTYEALKKHKLYKDKEGKSKTLETIIVELITRSTENGSVTGEPRAFTRIQERLEALNALPFYNPVSQQHTTVSLIMPISYSHSGKTGFSFNKDYFEKLIILHIEEAMRALIPKKDAQLPQLKNLRDQLEQDAKITKQLGAIRERINRLKMPNKLPLKEQISAALHTVASEDVSDKASSFQSAIEDFRKQIHAQEKSVKELVDDAKNGKISIEEATTNVNTLQTVNTELSNQITQNHAELGNIHQKYKPVISALNIIEHYSAIQNKNKTFRNNYIGKKLALQRGESHQNLLFNITEAEAFYQQAADAYQAFSEDARAFDFASNRSNLPGLPDAIQPVLGRDIETFIEGEQVQLKIDLGYSQQDTNVLLISQIIANAILNSNYWKQDASASTENIKDINGEEITVPRDIAHLSMLLASFEFDNWANDPEKARRLLSKLKQYAPEKNSGNSIQSLLEIIQSINHETTPALLRDKIITSFGNELLQGRNIIHPRQLDNLEIIKKPTFWERHPGAREVIIGAVIGAAVGLLITATVLFLPYLLPAVFGATLGGIVASIIATGTLAPIVLGISTLFSTIGAFIGRAVGRKNVTDESPRIQRSNRYDDVSLLIDEGMAGNVPVPAAQPTSRVVDVPSHNKLPPGTAIFPAAKTADSTKPFLHEVMRNFSKEKGLDTKKQSENFMDAVNKLGDKYLVSLIKDDLFSNAVRETLKKDEFESFDTNLLSAYPQFKAFVDRQKQALDKEDMPAKTPRK